MQRCLTGALALLAFVLTVGSSPAVAGDKPLVGPVPAWVRPAPEPSVANLPQAGNVVPLFDEQMLVEGDTVTGYFDSAILITSPELLNKIGTVSYPWQPDHGDITFHRIEVLRGGERIDALKNGANITVLHREAGLEQRVVDGRLTAIQHVEGLQVGDILRITVSISSRDTVLKGNIQDALLLPTAPVQIGFGRARLVWSDHRDLTWKALMPGLTPAVQPIDAGMQELVITLPVPKLPEMPKNYPARFDPRAILTFTSFHSWSEVKAVMAPLYRVSSAAPMGPDLTRRVDEIAAASTDPRRRLADALQLVQDNVRYQAVALGEGNYVPQAPEDTWVKRYGDCKAKTMLLLAVLDRLGITAEPALVSSSRGDAVRDMPPSAMAFDHVFVRAEIDGQSYWLDGTSMGSRLEDINNVPLYGTVLPLFNPATDLVDLPRRAHARPDLDIDLAYDMSAGPHLPAAFHLQLKYAGLYGASRRIEGGDAEEKLKTFAETAAKHWIGSDDIGKPQASFDAVNAIWTVRVDGVSYPDWKFEDGHYQLELPPNLRVELDAARGRAAWRNIPAVIPDTWTAHSHVTVKLPDGGGGATLTGSTTRTLSVPAADWKRTVTLGDGIVVEDIFSRETGAEIPPESISGTHKTIKDAMDKTAYVVLPTGYPERWIDAPRMRSAPAILRIKEIYEERIADKPDDAGRVADRAWLQNRLLNYPGAEQDYGRAIKLDGSSKRYIDRATIRSRLGDHPGALQDAQAAYNLEEGNSSARSWLANELTYAGQIDQAIPLLNSEPDVATEDGIGDFLQTLDLYEMAGRFDDASELLDAALKKHPRMSKLLNARCWLRGLHNSELEGALVDCNRAIELSADPATYLDSRGMVHFRAGRYPEALGDYNAALDADPQFTNSLFMAAVVLAKMGKADEARERLNAARTLNPNLDQYYAKFGIKP